MNKRINQNKTIALIIVGLLSTSLFLLSAIPLKAQTEYENMQEGGSMPLPAGVTPDLRLETTPYLSFRPNPVGVNQIILVNLWMTPPLHVSRYFSDYTITVTAPDGTENVVVMDSYRADATAWFEWIVDQVGDWKLKFEFPGGYFPPGNYTIAAGAFFSQTADTIVNFPESVYYEPSSTQEQTLTVQEDIVYSWPEAALPTDYWTRPVSPEKREWWPYIGFYPGNGVVGGGPVWDQLYPDTNPYGGSMADNEFYPYVQGPNTAHVVWKRLDAISGLIGGPMGYDSFTSGGNTPELVYAGRCYNSITKVVNGEITNVWMCSDLRTGEIYWERTGVSAPSYVHFEEGRSEVPGGDPVFGRNDYLMRISGSSLQMFDPWDGSLDRDVTIMSLGSSTFYADPYVLGIQNLGGGNYRLINWTVNGNTNNFTERIMSNTTFPWNNLGDSQDFEAMIAFDVYGITPPSTGVQTQLGVRAADMLTGLELWDKTIEGDDYSGSCTLADHGKGAVLMIGGYFLAWDLRTGNLAWQSEKMDYPWSQPSFGAYDATSAYGMFYRQAYDGVYAFDWNDGSIVWHYKAPTPYVYETPYIDSEGKGVYSFNSGSKVADGKLFTQNSEHTTTQPVTRGWQTHCIDVFTGKCVWNISGPMTPGAIADGYLTAGNSYDGYMYVFGKGKSVTTVSAPQVGVTKGTPFVITGSVLDLSPAQPGTPCVSEGSMTLQMEYLHSQRSIGGLNGDAIITGVPVTITAVGSDGTYVDIGTTTSNGYYRNFGIVWTPKKEGTYEIVASFAGDESYGSSAAATTIVVGPALSPSVPVEPEQPEPEIPEEPETPEEPEIPEEPETPEEPVTPEEPGTPEEPETEPTTETPLISTEIAIIAVVAVASVIGLVSFWALRKRK